MWPASPRPRRRVQLCRRPCLAELPRLAGRLIPIGQCDTRGPPRRAVTSAEGSLMTTPFDYREMDRVLVGELCDSVMRGESTAVLGASFSGKTLLVRQVKAQLKERQAGPIARISLAPARSVSTEQELTLIVAQALSRQLKRPLPQTARTVAELLEGIRQWDSRSPILLITHLDSILQPLARRLLTQIRTYQQEHPIGVIFTGDFDLTELVHGPNSEKIGRAH